MTELEKLAAAVRGKLVGKANASARQYSLRQGEDGKMTCTCGDYKYRRAGDGTECKHIKAHKGAPMIRDSVKEGAEAALEKFAGRASQQAIAALEQSLGKPLSKYTGSRGPGDVVPALNRATRLRHIGDPRATAALAHPAVSRAYGPDVGSLPGGASPAADATDAIYGHRLSIAREPGADIPHSIELSQRLQGHAHSKQVEKRWPAWRQSVPFIGDGVKEGAEAALAKYAIEYKSPKMQAVLQGAMDKAFANGASPLLARRIHIPKIGRSFDFRDPRGTRGPGGEARKTLRKMLIEQHYDGQSAYKNRIEEIKAGVREPVTTPREMTTSIGRPKENAIRAMLTQPLNRRAGSLPTTSFKDYRKHLARRVADPNPYGSYSEKHPMATLLNDLYERRSKRPGEGAMYGHENDAYHQTRALMQKHVPDIVKKEEDAYQAALAARKRKSSEGQ